MAFLQKASYLSAELVKNFKGRGGFVELRNFDKRFVKNTRKKVLQQNILHFFLLDTPRIENVTQRWKKLGSFLVHLTILWGWRLKGLIFDRLLKMLLVNGPRSWIWHGSICKGYSGSELVSICLNMPQYPLMSPNMPDKLINIEYPWMSQQMPK